MAVLLCTLPQVRAQVPEPTIVVVGTTIQSPLDGSHWGYLSWLASRPELLRDRSYAVYLKDGDADAPLPFRHVGTVKPQTDPATVKTLFERSRHLGQDRAKLDESISAYFDQLHPGGGVAVEDMFAALTVESLQDDNIFQMLVFMGRAHPGAALSLGTGFATRIHNGTSTFELREKAPGSDEFSAVVGRVTVTAGSPPTFPASGPPVVVPTADRNRNPLPPGDVTNHMNVKLRWESPAALRKQSLLLRGFHVYRVTRAYAEANGWHTCPAPALAALDWDAETLAAFPQVAKVNRLPIMPRRFYNNDEVVDFDLDEGDGIKGDLDFYTQDDNRHNGLDFDADGNSFDRNNTFVPGAEFYYYVVCEDLLGRKGAASCGSLVKVCDRTPPVAPKRVRVTNDFAYNTTNNTADQRLRVSWQALPDNENTVAYFVYRWPTLPALRAAENANPLTLGPENLVAGPIAHTTGGDTLSVLDNADPVHSPKTGSDPQFGAAGEDAGVTWWYTVVAVDDSACGGNFSPHSAPASGVLRDRAAPLGGGGSLLVRCCSVLLEPARDSQQTSQLPEPADPLRLTFDLTVNRFGNRPELIREAEFWLYDEKNNLTFPIASGEFPQSTTVPLNIRAGIPRPEPLDGTYFLQGRVITEDGRESSVVSVSLPNFPVRFLHTGAFEATRSCGIRTLRIDESSDCDTHEAVAEDGEETTPLEVEMEFPFGIREWRLYRSVNDAEPTLARQGILGTPSAALETLKVQDLIYAVRGGRVCYFAQYFDEHGNGGPMHELGCVNFTGLPPPTPTLSRIRPIEDGGNRKARVRWFCPTVGVEYFEVHITRKPGLPPSNLSSALTPDGVTSNKIGVFNNIPVILNGRRYRTGIVGGDLPNNGPQFTIELENIGLDETFHVSVIAVGRNGKKSKRSNVEEFSWEVPEEVVLPEVRWPARPVPPQTAKSDWDSRIEARYLGTTLTGYRRVGVRIGQDFGVRDCLNTNGANPIFALPGNIDPVTRVFTDGDYEGAPRLLPGMLYRYQVANSLFDEVSNDIVQVTPMMENIAYDYQTPVAGLLGPCNGVRIYDPHIAVTGSLVGGSSITYDIWLLDSMPVVPGARYAYLLVVFNDAGEIRTIIPAGEVDIPLNP